MEVISAGEGKERMKWDRHSYRQDNPLDPRCGQCGEPREFRMHVPYDPKQNRYPKMLHKAFKREDGKIMYGAPEPHPSHFKEASEYWRALTEMEHINKRCQVLVHSEGEEAALKGNGEGWFDTPAEAIAFVKSLEDAISEAAAHRHWDDRNMSEKAKAEAAAVDEASAEHQPEIPAKRKRGRPRKNEVIAS